MEFISLSFKIMLQKHIVLKIPNITLLFKLITIYFKHARRTRKEKSKWCLQKIRKYLNLHAVQDRTALIGLHIQRVEKVYKNTH